MREHVSTLEVVYVCVRACACVYASSVRGAGKVASGELRN